MHFSITGEALTRLARERMLEETPGEAFSLLKESLLGPKGHAEHYAPKILDGEMKLTGDESGMECVDDEDSADYKEELRYIYAGRVRIKGSWFRPVARLQTGPGDPHDPDPKKYMNDGWIAVRIPGGWMDGPPSSIRGGPRMLFEPVGEPPFWWDKIKTPLQAFRDFDKAGRRLELIPTDFRLEQDDEVGLMRKQAARVIASTPLSAEEEAANDAEYQALWNAEEKRSAQWTAEVERVREGVLAQAGDDLISLTLKDGTVIHNVARAPFMHWALDRTPVRHLAPPWEPVSQSGMKLVMDNPYHTDWLLGAGLSIHKDTYGSPVAEAAYEVAFEYVHQFTDHDAMVLSEGTGKSLSGVVGEEILILRDLHPDHLSEVLAAKAVITEIGGALAHLSLVARESGIPILLVPDAITKFPPGTYLQINPQNGSIYIARNPERKEPDVNLD
jgi:phosphohistidine swiveling domain-containing protein